MAGALTHSPVDCGRTARQSGPTLAWSVGLALGVLALSLRVPHLGLIPRFTDETDNVVHALAIARGHQLPLTDTDAYIGAGLSYLLAGALLLFGPYPVLRRYVVMVTAS